MITASEECKLAGGIFGSNWRKSGDEKHWPAGCHCTEGCTHTYFNTNFHPTKTNMRYFGICKYECKRIKRTQIDLNIIFGKVRISSCVHYFIYRFT